MPLALLLLLMSCLPKPAHEDLDGDGSFNDKDCNDDPNDPASASIYPGAEEIPYDGIDQDCDQVCDYDQDGDGFVHADYFEEASADEVCRSLQSVIDGLSDCDDVDPDAYPGAPEFIDTVDNDCDGSVTTISLSSANHYSLGENAGDGFGHGIGGGGDVNGDGIDDILIGAPFNADTALNAGKVYIFYGPAPATIDLGSADVTFTGETADNYTGANFVSIVGDIDNDGYDDFLIGSDRNNSSAGKTYLVYGSSSLSSNIALGDVGSTVAGAAFTGDNTSDYVGFSASGAGDVDNDGNDDFLIGAYGVNSQTGAVYLFYGNGSYSGTTSIASSAAATFEGEAAGDRAGISVTSLGDLDGDGYAEFGIGSYFNDHAATNAGKTYIFYGGSTLYSGTYTLGTDEDAALIGETADDYSGYAIAAGGDIDGDTYDDVIVGAYGSDDTVTDGGKTYIKLGGASRLSGDYDLTTDADATITGVNSSGASGFSVAGIGDLNVDGFDDFIIGEYGYSSSTGATYLFFGATSFAGSTLSDADFILIGENSGDESGQAIHAAGDFDGSGAPDLLIGAFLNDDTGLNGGKFYVFLSGY